MQLLVFYALFSSERASVTSVISKSPKYKPVIRLNKKCKTAKY